MVDRPGGRPPGLGARSPITVAERLLDIEPVVVTADTPLSALIRRAGSSPATRVIGVVDGAGVLIGVISSHDLVAAVVGRIAPGALIADIHDVAGVQEFDRYVEGRTAADLMREPAGLPPTATLAEAFHLMHVRGLSGVYVVDGASRPTGYVDGLELAAAVEAPLSGDAAV
jgi:CBS domain-containing protein